MHMTPSGSSVPILDLCESHEQTFKIVMFWFILANAFLSIEAAE